MAARRIAKLRPQSSHATITRSIEGRKFDATPWTVGMHSIQAAFDRPQHPTSAIESHRCIVAQQRHRALQRDVERYAKHLAALAPSYIDQALTTLRHFNGQVLNQRVVRRRTRAINPLYVEAMVRDLAHLEPIDAVVPHPVAVATRSSGLEPPAVVVRRQAKMIGASPIVMTLRESYVPYDLTAMDRPVWKALPKRFQPLCLHDDYQRRILATETGRRQRGLETAVAPETFGESVDRMGQWFTAGYELAKMRWNDQQRVYRQALVSPTPLR